MNNFIFRTWLFGFSTICIDQYYNVLSPLPKEMSALMIMKWKQRSEAALQLRHVCCLMPEEAVC